MSSTKRQRIAEAIVPSADDRKRQIESEPLPENIATLISDASKRGGDKQVWDFFERGEILRYCELQSKVHALADGLRSIGVKKSVHVAVMMPSKAAMPLTWLALGVIGAVMVPMNNSYSEREIAFVLNDSDATFLVVDESLISAISNVVARGEVRLVSNHIIVSGKNPGPYIWLETLLEHPISSEFVDHSIVQDDLLNIQYTSGTTGFPKGCMLSQRYWLSAGKVTARRDGRDFKSILASTPFYYMDPQWLLLMSMYQTATLHVAQRQSSSRFMHWVREHEVEFCLLPAVILKHSPDPNDDRNCVIRANVYGVSRQAHAELEARFDLCAREAFGMTEIGPSLYMPIERMEMVGSGSCGMPGPFREAKVVDENGNTVPIGEVGELVIRGPGIFQGYYNRVEATRNAFFEDWFRTGDLFRQDENGYFYIIGRIKDSIRRAGENIAAREVESVLNSYSYVEESAVVPVPDEMRGEEVKALIIWKGAVPNADDLPSLIAHCQQNLAPFKVPRYFQFVTKLPRTASEKIAKHQIPAVNPHAITGVFDRVKPD